MFTNNYLNLRHNVFFGVLSPTDSWGGVYGKSYVNILGTEINAYSSSSSYFADIGRMLANGRCNTLPTSYVSTYTDVSFGVFFGSGSTPATKEDYTLENPITSGLTVTSSPVIISDDSLGQYFVTGRYILVNTTGEDISIREIGVFAPIASGSNSKYHSCLMERTVLDEPITIPAGEAKLITYKVAFNQT